MFIYIHLFYCTIKTSKWPWTLLKGQRYSTASHKFQISLHFSLQTPVFELQAILRQGHQMTPKWPWTRRVQRHQYKIWVHLHTGRFKKIAISYPGMIFSHWQKFQKLYIHSLSTTPPPHEIELIFALQAVVSEIWTDFQIAIFGCETCSLTKHPEIAHIPSFCPKGLKLALLFSLYEQWFPRYGMISKIAIFERETWPLAKVSEVAHILSFYHKDWNWAYICSSYRQRFPR